MILKDTFKETLVISRESFLSRVWLIIYVYMDTIHSCTLNAGLFLNALNVRTCISITRMHMNTQTCMCTRT